MRPRHAPALLLAAAATLGLAPPSAAQTVTLKIATLVPQGSSWHTTLQEMAAKWQEASGGRVVVRLYPGGVAGDDNDVVRKMRLIPISIPIVLGLAWAAIAPMLPLLLFEYPIADIATKFLTRLTGL